jgi:triacylglycerol lipase
MYFPSAPFSPNDAVIFSALVNAAYDMYAQWAARGCPSDPSQFSWAEPTGPLVPNGPTLSYLGPMWGVANADDYAFPEPFAFLAWESNGRTYLVFRGSETSADFWEDAAFDQVSYDPIVPGLGLVHDGFNDVYTSSYSSTGYSVAALRSTILSALGHLSYTPTALYVSGHSLGAGLSTLCVPDVARNSQLGKLGIPMFHYSLASPRVGDPAFAYNYNFQIPVATFRIANTEDLVPDGPPAVSEWYYEHVGTPVSFTAQYDSIGGNHDHQHCYFYALTHPNQPQGPIAALRSAELPSSARTRVVAARRRYEQLKGNPQPRRQS